MSARRCSASRCGASRRSCGWSPRCCRPSACSCARPSSGLPLTGFIGPSMLLFGLAVAVIARMESLPTAFFGGMLIGVIDRAGGVRAPGARRWPTPSCSWSSSSRCSRSAGKLSRAMDTGASSWQTSRRSDRFPPELRHLPRGSNRTARARALVGALAVGAPWIFGSFKQSAATLILLYAMIGVSLVILTGWAGQISLGQYAIAGIGSAVAGGLAANHGWDFFGALFTGALAGALVAVLVGLPALRIQGLFLAVTTLVVRVHGRRTSSCAVSGSPGSCPKDNTLRRPSGALRALGPHRAVRRSARGSPSSPTPSSISCASRSSARRWPWRARCARTARDASSSASRDNGRVMQAYGVSLASTRLAAFAISGFIAGLAGAPAGVPEHGVLARSVQPRAVDRTVRDGGHRRRRLAARRGARRGLPGRPAAAAGLARHRVRRTAHERPRRAARARVPARRSGRGRVPGPRHVPAPCRGHATTSTWRASWPTRWSMPSRLGRATTW